MEVWEQNNESHLRAIKQLFSLGYSMYRITSAGDLQFMAKQGKEIIFPQRVGNYDNFIFKR